ncbi:hypothetical protein D9V37_10690 [Nocardioides mangrovicus]|uniref:Alpha/beta hydrolase n=1 Tax=Nocardioides mangrovicus TaxID=2478913 RepID=A0A3L8P242_9ACTN|nr:hypothetical protein D9V37_10690 [Nocardioides mangrovicus]
MCTVEELPGDAGVLVPHSNAGYWVAGRGPTVFVDAALPPPGAVRTPLAPPGLRTFLAGLADDDGLLPPWTRWWDDVDALFPDAPARRAVEAEQPRLPLTWFDQEVDVPPAWAEVPSAYLAFGDTYAEETALARSLSWPVVVIDGAHLHMLHDPAGVAAAIVSLAP